ncbi:MAG: serine/threonine protein kinase [Acidobacteria bacterium]|nr:serine/threonine protein kinase [Acidobacteriota bacterium]
MADQVPAPLGVVAHYNLLERLEPAGPGELYRARDTRLGRTVAVRLLRDPAPAGGDSTALLTEAKALQVLTHPNVTALFDAGLHDGLPYFVFEFLQGQALRAEMGGGVLGVHRAVDIAVQIADAVASAHAAGFLHGGLSPDSVFISAKGRVKVPAFPLASRHGFPAGARQAQLLDSPAPEETAGAAPDVRSDVYSVGAILFEMLTARVPQPRGSAAPSATNPRVPAALDAVVLKAVAPNPARRYPDLLPLLAELRALRTALERSDEADEPVAASSAGRARPARLGLVLAGMAMAAALAWWLLSGR